MQHKLNFSFAGAIISMILEMVSFSVPCDMYPAQSLRIHSSFTTHLVYAHTSRKTCFGRERYVLLQGIDVLHLETCFNRFVHTLQKLGEYKVKGCTLFSP